MEKFGASFSGRSYLMSVTPLKVVTLADNNNTDNSNSGSCNCKGAFSPSLPVVMLVLFGIFLFTCFFSICARRRSTNWDRRGARGNGNNIIEVISREVARGLKRADIESFPIFSYNLVKGIQAQAKCSECAVCLSDFAEDEMLRLLPKCSHAFHPECIDEWLFTHTTCPLCRTSLVLADDSIPTPADFGLVEPQAPPEEITVIIDNGGGVSLRMDISNDEATNGGPGYDLMGYSLVRVRKEIEQPTEWYIATAEGLTRGLHRSCSFVGAHHSHESSGSNAPPACSKPGGFVGEAGHRSRSERWGSTSMKPASVLRTFSMGILPRARGQVGVEQQDDKARLKGKFSSLMGRDREGDGTGLSQSGSLSYRYADQSGSCSAE